MDKEIMSKCNARYQKALRSNKQYALVNMNVKKFRYMNYAHGRIAANQILCDVEKTIRSFLKEDECIVRKDADDFIMLVTYTSKKDFEKIWLVNLVDVLFDIDNTLVHHNIYTSFGIVFMESKEMDFEEAFEKAQFCRLMDESYDRRVFSYEIYRQSVYDEYMHSCYLEEYTAMAREKGMYQVYIQPKIDLKTREIVGGEALLRLFDHGKAIPVSEFLPILNKNGYIRMVDLYVFETVVKELKERDTQGKQNVRISFNVSNSFFNDEYFIRDYSDILERVDIDTKFLEIEFMESICTNEDKMKEYIQEFHEMGFQCSLDDFGNGFSNFNLLKDSKLDVVKIDRCFFTDEMSDEDKEILKTIMHLIKMVNMEVVAEGVERKEDIEFLSTIGCDTVQGFYFYKPMPMKDFFALLDEKNHS